MNSHRLHAYFLLLIVSLIWAIAGPVIKFVLGKVDPLTFLTARFFISSLAAIGYSLRFGFHFPKNIKNAALFIISGIFTSSICLGLLFWGMKDTTVIESSLIELAGPLVISIAGVLFLKENITHREKIGIGIALLGSLITVIEPILFNHNRFLFSGNFLIFIYLIAAAIPAVINKELLRKGIDPISLTNFSFIIGFFSFFPFLISKPDSLIVLKSIFNLPAEYLLGIVFMALFSGNIAYALANKAQKTIEVSEAALFSYLYPLLSIPLAILWLHEKITSVFILGAVIVLVGVVVAELKGNSNVKFHISKQ